MSSTDLAYHAVCRLRDCYMRCPVLSWRMVLPASAAKPSRLARRFGGAYACWTQCPVLTYTRSHSVLRIRYAISGTDNPLRHTRLCHALSDTDLRSQPICYAVPGTELGYGATRARQTPSWTLLPLPTGTVPAYALSGTDKRYHPTRCPVQMYTPSGYIILRAARSTRRAAVPSYAISGTELRGVAVGGCRTTTGSGSGAALQAALRTSAPPSARYRHSPPVQTPLVAAS
eukprot:1413295-Rhodomonas_salina.2